MKFLAYLAAVLFIMLGKGFGITGWLQTFAASLVPFGTFLHDPDIGRKEASLASARAT